jgi:hypothetical protein
MGEALSGRTSSTPEYSISSGVLLADPIPAGFSLFDLWPEASEWI